MAVSQQKVTVAECDSCGAKRYGEDGAKIPGVHGRVTVISDRQPGEVSVEFFSCRGDAGHVGKAIIKAIEQRSSSSESMRGAVDRQEHTKMTTSAWSGASG